MPTILLVEDELTFAEALRYNLEREGYLVLHASDGIQGLDLARRELPNLIVLDIMLPRLDGFSICRILRQESDVPIMWSSNTSPSRTAPRAAATRWSPRRKSRMSCGSKKASTTWSEACQASSRPAGSA